MKNNLKTSFFRKPLDLKIQPYFLDHQVEGRPVLPGVETMQILAQETDASNVNILESVSFTKFIYIPSDKSKQKFFCDRMIQDDDSILVKLISVTKIGTISRSKEHAAGCFRQDQPRINSSWRGGSLDASSDPRVELSPDVVYTDIVRFGPAYQNIIRVWISKQGAAARVKSGVLDHTSRLLGSSFPLDAAFHAACVWGQRFCGFIGFPIGIEKRIILKPTQPNSIYTAMVIPVHKQSDFFSADIRIQDETTVVYEDLIGVQMKDISGGKRKQPQ